MNLSELGAMLSERALLLIILCAVWCQMGQKVLSQADISNNASLHCTAVRGRMSKKERNAFNVGVSSLGLMSLSTGLHQTQQVTYLISVKPNFFNIQTFRFLPELLSWLKSGQEQNTSRTNCSCWVSISTCVLVFLLLLGPFGHPAFLHFPSQGAGGWWLRLQHAAAVTALAVMWTMAATRRLVHLGLLHVSPAKVVCQPQETPQRHEQRMVTICQH